MRAWLWKIKVALAAAAVFAIWLLRGQVQRAKQEAAAQRKRADVQEDVNKEAQRIRAARTKVQEEAQDVEREHEARKVVDDRPDTFGDPRLRR